MVRIADGYALDDLRNNTLLLAQEKLWIFNLSYKAQNTLHFGNHVVHTGCDLLTFDLKTLTWNKTVVPTITNEENVSEHLFVFEDQIHLILFKNFNGILLEGLYKFNGDSFDKQKFEAPPEVTLEEGVRVSAITASGTTSENELILILNGEGMHVFKLSIGESSKAQFIVNAHEEPSPMRGTATSAVVLKNNLAISYGVHGCGFRWEAERLVKIDLNKKTSETINFVSSTKPPFCFNGAKSTTLKNEEWIHAGGSVQTGMTGSRFDGTVWKLINVFGETPEWEKIEIQLTDGDVVAHGQEIYTVSKTDVNHYTF